MSSAVVALARARIGDLVDEVKTCNPERAAPDSTFVYVDLSSIDESKQIGNPRHIKAADAPSRARQCIKADDVLVSTVRPNLNGVARVPNELNGAIASTGFCVLRPRPSVLCSAYLFHWVKSPLFVGEMTRRSTGASYPAVTDSIVLDSAIPLPPLPEQHRIAAILDKADALRGTRRTALDTLRGAAQATFSQMFGDPVRNERGYPTRPLIDLVDPDRPISYGILMPGPDQVDGVPYIRVVDMKDAGIDLAGVRRTTRSISEAYRRSLLKPGDLLMSIRGHVGRFAFIPPELDGANITQDTARLAVSGAVPVFVRECLQTTSFQRWMEQRTKGVAVRGINLGDVKQMPIILPPKHKQEEFAKAIIALDRLASLQVRALHSSVSLFSSLQQRAFTGAL